MLPELLVFTRAKNLNRSFLTFDTQVNPFNPFSLLYLIHFILYLLPWHLFISF